MILENVKDVITCKTRIIHIHTYINSYVKLYMIKIRFEMFTLGLGMKEWGRANTINLIFCMKYKTKRSLLSMIPLIYLYHFNLHLYVQEEIQWCFIFRTWILIHLNLYFSWLFYRGFYNKERRIFHHSFEDSQLLNLLP